MQGLTFFNPSERILLAYKKFCIFCNYWKMVLFWVAVLSDFNAVS